MDDRLISLYLSRILSGYYVFIFNNQKYKLLYPSIDIKYQAELLAQEEFDKNKYNDWMTKESLLYSLISLGLWPSNGDKELTKLDEQIENLKVDLYKNFYNKVKQKNIRKSLQNYKRQYNIYYNKRHSYDHITLEGYCDNIKNEYILIHSLYNENGLIFDKNNVDTALLKDIAFYISQNTISITDFKTISRSPIWKNYWSVNENNLFDRPTINWTDEQKTLVVLTKMYENARESPDCPPDEVFEDDDVFDGWMISQRRKIEEEKKKRRTEKSLPGKLDKAQEVFLVAGSKEDAENIYDLNDHENRQVIKERESFLQYSAKNGNKKITVTQLPDVQRDIITQSNELRKNRGR